MGWVNVFCHGLLELITPAEADSLFLQQNWLWSFDRDKPAMSATTYFGFGVPFFDPTSPLQFEFFDGGKIPSQVLSCLGWEKRSN